MDIDSTNTNSKENTNSSNDPPTDEKNSESKKDVDIRYAVELTRAIKENHGSAIVDARLCPFKGGEAFFATIGNNQMMVYDCEVRGNFISTLLNYRNWHLQTMRCKNVVWKENLEKNHEKELEKKSFNALCWIKRWKDFWIAVADNEQQIHLLSLTHAKCVKLIKCDCDVNDLIAHPLYPNILCTIDCNNKCKFINIANEETIYVCPEKITKIRFSADGNRFCAVTANGSIREYSQKTEMIDDDMKDADLDMEMNGNESKKTNKRLCVTQLNTYKAENKGEDICDMRYYGERVVIIGNESGEFKMVNMDSIQLLHSWKVGFPISKGNACTFDVNIESDLMVYGNGAHQVQIYDLKKKKYVRRVDTGRGRKLPFSFAMFCKHHKQSIMMVCDSIVMKFDPLELVQDYFPSTADFAIQKRNGVKQFNMVKTVEYEVDKIKN